MFNERFNTKQTKTLSKKNDETSHIYKRRMNIDNDSQRTNLIIIIIYNLNETMDFTSMAKLTTSSHSDWEVSEKRKKEMISLLLSIVTVH